MTEEDKKELFKSLNEAKEKNVKSALDDNLKLKRELLIGNCVI